MSGICAGEPGCASATAETPLMTATRAPRCSVLDPLHSQTSATNATRRGLGDSCCLLACFGLVAFDSVLR